MALLIVIIFVKRFDLRGEHLLRQTTTTSLARIQLWVNHRVGFGHFLELWGQGHLHVKEGIERFIITALARGQDVASLLPFLSYFLMTLLDGFCKGIFRVTSSE